MSKVVTVKVRPVPNCFSLAASNTISIISNKTKILTGDPSQTNRSKMMVYQIIMKFLNEIPVLLLKFIRKSYWCERRRLEFEGRREHHWPFRGLILLFLICTFLCGIHNASTCAIIYQENPNELANDTYFQMEESAYPLLMSSVLRLFPRMSPSLM